ncbi:alpha/beta hydrolase fold domain-containing protein [Sphingomonas sp. CL5.1]|nr:alpha/beta hydrolase fold domain-containing protein [Sphingomonas sp. CL5.1]
MPAGISVAIPEFGKLPGTAMPDVVEQIRRVIEWAGQNAGSFGYDAGNLHMVGHSAGAHLAATTATADRSPGTVRSLACISGIYNLIPVMLSARRHYVYLSPQEILRLSPLRHLQNLTCKTSVFFAEGDSMEFKRQSQVFVDSLETAGKLFFSRRFVANHYDVLDMLDSPESLLSCALRQVALAT